LKVAVTIREHHQDELLTMALMRGLINTPLFRQVVPQIHCKGIWKTNLNSWGWELLSTHLNLASWGKTRTSHLWRSRSGAACC